MTFPESDPGDNNEFIDSTIEKMYAKDRQRLNLLKQPETSNSQSKPVAAVVGTNISHPSDKSEQTTPAQAASNVSQVQNTLSDFISSQTTSVQATSNVSQVQNNLSDFISSLNLTGNAETKPDSNSLGNQILSGLLPTPSLDSNAVTVIPQLESNPVAAIPQLTINPMQQQHQLQRQQQMLQMQLLHCQQLMLHNMGTYGAPVGHSGMPNINYSMGGVGGGVPAANLQGSADGRSSVDAALDMVTSALSVNPTFGRGSHSPNVRPPPGGFEKRN